MLLFRSTFPRQRQVRTGQFSLLYFNLDLTKGQPEQVNTQFFSIQLKIQSNVDPNKGQSEQVKDQIKSFHRSVLCGPGHRSIRPHQPNQLGLGFKWAFGPQVIDCTRNWQLCVRLHGDSNQRSRRLNSMWTGTEAITITSN